MIKRLLREPLLHFLLLGALLFAAHDILARGGSREPGRIVVTQGQIESMAMLFSRTWQRAPSDDELQGLIRNHVREEVLYREGLALGLDRDDPIIRRRIGQKLEFVSENAEAAEPSDEDLQAYLASHRAAFVTESKLTFRHIYIDPRRHDQTIAAEAQRMLNELNDMVKAPVKSELGDPTTLPLDFDKATASHIKNTLGDKFWETIDRIVPGPWTGPVESGYGMHLVQVSERTEPGIPKLVDVREAVKREWQFTRRIETAETSYQNLLQRYTVTVERPGLTGKAGEVGSKGLQ
jgi:hypothetical protein